MYSFKNKKDKVEKVYGKEKKATQKGLKEKSEVLKGHKAVNMKSQEEKGFI